MQHWFSFQTSLYSTVTPTPSLPALLMGWRERIYWSTVLSFFIHPAIHCLVLLIPPPPSLLSWLCQRSSPVCSSSCPELGLNVDTHQHGKYVMFYSIALCYRHTGSDTCFIWTSLAVYFPGLTNQGPCLYRGDTATTHTRACRVSLESVGEKGGGRLVRDWQLL